MKKKVIAVIIGLMVYSLPGTILHLNFHHWTGYILDGVFFLMGLVSTLAWLAQLEGRRANANNEKTAQLEKE